MRKGYSQTGHLLIVFCFMLASSFSYASGFYFPFQNASGFGVIYAGGAAIADDASTAYYNPAGLVRIPQMQVVTSGVHLDPCIILSGTATTGTEAPGFPQTGNAQASISGIIPAVHFAIPLTHDLFFAFSFTAPFGFGNEYQPLSPLRYTATNTTFLTTDMGPSLAYRINAHFSIGAGINFIQASENMGTFSNLSSSDGFLRNKADAWGLGYHAGVLYQLSALTRFGLSYSSQVTEHLTGSSTLTGVPLTGSVVSNNYKHTLRLPPITRFSAYHDLTSRCPLMGNVMYTQWNVFRNASFQNVASVVDLITFNPTMINVTLPLNWRNTWEGALGLNYKLTKRWQIRGGASLMQTPTNDATRDVRFPDANMLVIGAGAHFQITPEVGMDGGYARAMQKTALIMQTDTLTNNTVSGTAKTNADMIGFQLTININ